MVCVNECEENAEAATRHDTTSQPQSDRQTVSQTDRGEERRVGKGVGVHAQIDIVM